MLLTKSVSSTQECIVSRTLGEFTINYGQIVESVVTECIVSNVDAEGGLKQNNGVRCLAIWVQVQPALSSLETSSTN